MKRLILTAAICAVALAAAIPAAAVTANSPPVRHYSLEFTPIFGDNIPSSGTLSIRIWNDGIVQGTYSTVDGPQFVPVTGGRNGNAIWFDIGSSGSIHADGHFQGSRIVGTAISRRNVEYTFVAKPLPG